MSANTIPLALPSRAALTTRKLNAGYSSSRLVETGHLQGRRLIVSAQKESSGDGKKGDRRRWGFLRFFERAKPAEVTKPADVKQQPRVTQPPPPKPAEVKQPPVAQPAAAQPAATQPAVPKAAVASPPPTAQKGSSTAITNGVEMLLANNNEWAKTVSAHDPEFFPSLAKGQAPEFLWIGCSDSRVVPNLATGMKPGDIFVHRNVGNIIMHSDMNCMSALEFSIHALGVKHVIVCGHYGCGAVKAAMTLPQKSDGVTNCWIAQIREVRNFYAKELQKLSFDDQLDFMAEANAVHQAFNACTAPAVQSAWDKGLGVEVHAVIFDLATGKLDRLAGPITSLEQAKQAEATQYKHLSDKIAKDLTRVLSFEKTM